jgi:hypothetical protein
MYLEISVVVQMGIESANSVLEHPREIFIMVWHSICYCSYTLIQH